MKRKRNKPSRLPPAALLSGGLRRYEPEPKPTTKGPDLMLFIVQAVRITLAPDGDIVREGVPTFFVEALGAFNAKQLAHAIVGGVASIHTEPAHAGGIADLKGDPTHD